ncbi:MAG: phosphoribosyltransferase family protein [Actinobacteria bacterium]|nr:phosphoribosyltransferase family protein [Actinomycetota bacterium]
MFTDRKEAGEKLAVVLKDRNFQSPVVFGIPRGGVIVAAEIARILSAPISIVVPRKIGAPFNSEYGIGAVAPDGTVYIDQYAAKSTGADEDYLKKQVEIELEEARRRMKAYGFDVPKTLEGMTAIVVDDGIATGNTMIAALSFLEKLNPYMLIAAVPVAPQDTVEKLNRIADETIVLYTPLFFSAVGEFYYDFHQVSDEEVLSSLSGLSKFPSCDE